MCWCVDNKISDYDIGSNLGIFILAPITILNLKKKCLKVYIIENGWGFGVKANSIWLDYPVEADLYKTTGTCQKHITIFK